MRRHVSIAALTIFSLVLLAPAAWGQSSCQQLQGSENLQYLGFWTGPVDVVLGGESLHGVVSYTLTSITPNGPDVLTGTETATFNFGNGNTITVQDHFSFRPASGLYDAVNRVTDGTGRFENAFGKFAVHGHVDFSNLPPTFTSAMRGAICTN